MEHLGSVDAVTSPTYTILQTYRLSTGIVAHLDLYRIKRPQELAALGLDYLHPQPQLTMIEWASLFSEHLPQPQIILTFSSNPFRVDCKQC